MSIRYEVLRARHNWSEREDFVLSRPDGTDEYLFLHFKSPVLFRLDAKEPKRIEKGTCILLSPHTPHGFHPVEGPLLHDWMHFNLLDPTDFDTLKIDQNVFLSPAETRFITEGVAVIEQELLSRPPLYRQMISAETERLFLHIKRSLSPTPAPMAHSHREAFEALRLDLYRHPESYLSTLDMAQKVQLSRSRFSVLYQELFRIPPVRDIIRARTERAAYYLSLKCHSVAEVAELCGYRNEYHFIRQFKKETGKTPGMYKKLL